MSVDLSCIVSFIVFDVMCVRCADLLLGCVGGPLMYLFGMLWCVMRSGDLLLGCVGGSLSLALSHFVVVCVGSADLLMGYVGGSLTRYPIYCFDVCGVYRSAPGLHRWASHASS